MSAIAYLDPGSGSFALQILLATLFGGLFALKQSWAELKVQVRARIVAIGGPGRASKEIARPRIHGQPTAEIQ